MSLIYLLTEKPVDMLKYNPGSQEHNQDEIGSFQLFQFSLGNLHIVFGLNEINYVKDAYQCDKYDKDYVPDG